MTGTAVADTLRLNGIDVVDAHAVSSLYGLGVEYGDAPAARQKNRAHAGRQAMLARRLARCAGDGRTGRVFQVRGVRAQRDAERQRP